jgi:hypothetical protein
MVVAARIFIRRLRRLIVFVRVFWLGALPCLLYGSVFFFVLRLFPCFFFGGFVLKLFSQLKQ